MESGHHVNPPPGEGRPNRESGGLKVYKLVGVTFGLLCIIQSALNVSLRLRSVGTSTGSNNVSTGNLTSMSADDIRVLITDRDQLIQEKAQLLREKKQLNRDNKQLVLENNQLRQSETRLTRDIKMLDDKILEQQSQMTKLQMEKDKANLSRCPPGWWMLMSSCYQLSCMPSTWEYARANCEKKGAHLVVFSDESEEDRIDEAIQALQVDKLWIGLSGQEDIFTWVDGNPLHFSNWNNQQPASWYSWTKSCVYVDQSSSALENWFLDTCHERYYWMCEKELDRGSV